jgi:hypothetical protein
MSMPKGQQRGKEAKKPKKPKLPPAPVSPFGSVPGKKS